MTRLLAHGISAVLPQGFEGRIFRRPAAPGARSYPIAQFATVAIPAVRGDFGAGIVERLGPSDVFLVLFEYGPESAGTPLFAQRGIPGVLRVDEFSPRTLRRGLGGQAGTQRFFTDGARPFTLYAVLGQFRLREVTVAKLNALLASIEIDPAAGAPTRAASASGGAGREHLGMQIEGTRGTRQ